MAQVQEQIAQLRKQFNGLSISQKKTFIDNLKTRIREGGRSLPVEYTRFLQQCINQYAQEVENDTSDTFKTSMDNTTANQNQGENKLGFLKWIVIPLLIVSLGYVVFHVIVRGIMGIPDLLIGGRIIELYPFLVLAILIFVATITPFIITDLFSGRSKIRKMIENSRERIKKEREEFEKRQEELKKQQEQQAKREQERIERIRQEQQAKGLENTGRNNYKNKVAINLSGIGSVICGIGVVMAIIIGIGALTAMSESSNYFVLGVSLLILVPIIIFASYIALTLYRGFAEMIHLLDEIRNKK